jgi:hypothetical protein|tara:strand:+ start:1249 stop:1632 length:384 start_codon:yes stop_codon:yes gene_type:complete
MPLAAENVEIVFEGLDQKTASALTAPGKLERAQNVEFDKAGQLNKRVGYQHISATAADGVGLSAINHRLALAQDELLVLSGYYGFALASVGESLQTGSRGLVLRGVMLGGSLSFDDVATGADVAEDG